MQFALKREISEELGCEIDNINEIGEVDDYYNLIHRHNINYYFCAHVSCKHESKLEEFEKVMFSEIVWVDINEAIKLLESNSCKVGTLVKNRELPVLYLAKKIIN